MSVYKGDLTQEGLNTAVAKIFISFPAIEDSDYFETFKARVKEKGFSDARLIDAVNNVIDTCVYPKPTIAQFLNFGDNIKLYNYKQKKALVNEMGDRANILYKAVVIDGEKNPMWAHIDDIVEHGLTPFKSDKSWKEKY